MQEQQSIQDTQVTTGASTRRRQQSLRDSLYWLRCCLRSVSGLCGAGLLLVQMLWSATASAGPQLYEPLSDAVRHTLQAAVHDRRVPEPLFVSAAHREYWLTDMHARLRPRVASDLLRDDLLKTARYEAQRAGLDPQLVLALIEVESGFRQYAVSSAGARGLMQVMPFWTRVIGDGNPAALFNMRTNIRYGCVILRHYLDIENGHLPRALARYNGSLGRSEYPNAVLSVLQRRWQVPQWVDRTDADSTQIRLANSAALPR